MFPVFIYGRKKGEEEIFLVSGDSLVYRAAMWPDKPADQVMAVMWIVVFGGLFILSVLLYFGFIEIPLR